jgi:hypothetical protein
MKRASPRHGKDRAGRETCCSPALSGGGIEAVVATTGASPISWRSETPLDEDRLNVWSAPVLQG